jgi:preprotein translocase subunit SecG
MNTTLKWTLIAVAVAVAAYLILAPKSKLIGTKGSASTGGAGGTMTGAGNLASGLAKLTDSVASIFKDDSATDTTAE